MNQSEHAIRAVEARALLDQHGGVQVGGHFELASGNHSRSYIHVRVALSIEDCARRLATLVLDEYREKYPDPTHIISWTLGGRLLASAIASLYGTSDYPRAIHLDRDQLIDNFALSSDDVPSNSSVLLVDDVLTTGETLGLIANQMHARFPGTLRAVAVVAWLGTVVPDFGSSRGTSAIWLTKVPIKYWPREKCPECSTGVPCDNFRDASVDPLQPLYSLPSGDAERFARQLARILREKDLQGTSLRKKVARALKGMEPLGELPSTKRRRIAVLGAMESWHLIKFACRAVSEAGYYAVTAEEVYEPHYPDSPRRRLLSLAAGVNTHLKDTISNCEFAIVTLSRDQAGQIIENEWCFEIGKPTLGLVEFRRLWPNAHTKTPCPYLRTVTGVGPNAPNKCEGYDAILRGRTPIGGEICEHHFTECPFPYSGLSIMVLDRYTRSQEMYLVGSDDFHYLLPVVQRFVRRGRI